jgi:PhoH-like ATPase
MRKSEETVRKRKTFIIDTSVLLYDSRSIHSFPRNDVVIPLVVLDELDRFKDKKGLIGENARYVNRYLDELRKKGNLHSGITIEDLDQTIKVELGGFDKVPVGLDPDCPDNRIISCVLQYSDKKDRHVIMVTKDINFRVKCDSLGISSEDYYKDRVVQHQDEFYKGYTDVIVDDPTIIDDLYLGNIFPDQLDDIFDAMGRKAYQNEYLCIKNGQKSFLGTYTGEKIKKVLSDKELDDGFVGIRAKNREQLFALNALNNDDVPLVSITGLAGSGKTFITLMSAISGLNQKKYERIVITRNIQPVGKDIGFLPGDLEDKMLPWMAPIMDNFRHGFKDKDLAYFGAMRAKGTIEVAPLSFIRGRTFNNTFLIMDEAQNATIHELKTVITRMGVGSKIVLLGDVDQIDTPYIDALSNGLTIIAEKFKNEKVAAHVQLKKGERSYLSSIAAKII